jgi:hypothetical protein
MAVQNAHSSDTTEKNGSVVTAVDKIGNFQTIDATVNDANDVSNLNTKYAQRWDDPRYYSGDSSTDS